MKSTILDIANASGLSTATVDRVLNNRAGVSATNRQRVLDAARQLGYLAVTDAVALPSKPAHLEFLIPGGSNDFMKNLVNNIEDFSSRLPLVASCKIHRPQDISPNEILNVIEKISLRTSAVGVIAPDHPKTRNAMREMSEAGVRFVTIASDIPSIPRASYIGIDNRVAGRTAALLLGRLSAGRKGRVAIFIGSRSYRGHEEREMGFRSVISEEFPHLSMGAPIEVNDEPDASYSAASSLLTDPGDLVGVYCVGAGRSGIVRALKSAKLQARPVFICHDLTEKTRRYLLDELVDAVIDQNARLMAEQAVIGMLGTLASAAPYLTRKFIEPRIIFRENIPVT